MKSNRRHFLTQLASVGAAGVSLGSGMRLARAQGARPNGNVLVVVFLRGGWDGLNVVVPHGESAYYDARPTIAIAPPASAGPGAALDLDGFFGLHPAMAALHGYYGSGQLALLPTVHYPTSRLSHFESQEHMERAGDGGNIGWLSRYLDTLDASARGLSIDSRLPASLQGSPAVAAYRDPLNLQFSADPAVEALLDRTLKEQYVIAAQAGHAPALAWKTAAQNLAADRLREERTVFNAANYPNNLFAQQLAAAATFIRNDPDLVVIGLDLDGWDTHTFQGGADGKQAGLLELLATSLAAFWEDLHERQNDVAVLVQSEFGRTVAENGSRGTDHGRATSWLVLSNRLNGGILTGMSGWPGLAPAQLADGRYLAHTVDYRDVYVELLGAHLGCPDPRAIVLGGPGPAVGLA